MIILANILLLICCWGVFRIIQKPSRFFLFPYISIFAYVCFLLPQTFALINFYYAGESNYISEWMIIRIEIMMIFCLLMIFLGFNKKPRSKYLEFHASYVDNRNFFYISIIYIFLGAFFYLKIFQLPMEAKEGIWTGIATIYYFFSKLALVGLIGISIFQFKKPTLFKKGLFLTSLSFYLIFIIFLGGRRTPTLHIFAILMITPYFIRRSQPSRIPILLFFIVAFFANLSISDYRSADAEQKYKIDFIGNAVAYFKGEAALELKNAMYLVDLTAKTGKYDYGKAIWNNLVFNYVPAQFVGQDTNDGLMLGSREAYKKMILDRYGYNMPTGLTITGIGDSFFMFGYLGIFLFYIIGKIMRFLWEMAYTKKNLYYQIIYVYLYATSVLVITHKVANFLPDLIYVVVFLSPLILISKRKAMST